MACKCELTNILDVEVTQNVLCVEIGNSIDTLWGKIIGNIENQTDLMEQLDELRTLAYAGL